MGGIAFQNVGGLKPGRTRFDWHFERKFDCSFGQLIPIFAKQCIPGDYFNIKIETLVRCTPLRVPVMHEVTVDTHFFFVPTRILDDHNSNAGCGNPKSDPLMLNGAAPPANRFHWELFNTGGHDGMDVQTPPRWIPSAASFTRPIDNIILKVPAPYKYSLWDYLGYPVLPDNTPYQSNLFPLDFKRRAYNCIWNEYYRDETLQDPISWENEFILLRSWRKDYFTSSLPFQQRGVAPSFPISGTLNLSFPNLVGYIGSPTNAPNSTVRFNDIQNSNYFDVSGFVQNANNTSGNVIKNYLEKGNVNLSDAVTFDVSDLRLAVQLQKWLERNARAGARYIENLYAHWGVSPNDQRLQRPHYIGGTKTPLIISEVIQSSQTDTTPQGNMAGHGITSSGGNVGTFNVEEYGYIIGLMSVMPRPQYQQGFDREDLYETRHDWPWPEFVNLSEQDILQGELYLANNSTDSQLFGYQGRYDELRTMNSTATGGFRDTLSHWHLGRIFDSTPYLNSNFIECNPLYLKRIFSVQNEPGLLCDVVFNLTGVRPIPEIAEPGLLDHH